MYKVIRKYSRFDIKFKDGTDDDKLVESFKQDEPLKYLYYTHKTKIDGKLRLKSYMGTALTTHIDYETVRNRTNFIVILCMENTEIASYETTAILSADLVFPESTDRFKDYYISRNEIREISIDDINNNTDQPFKFLYIIKNDEQHMETYRPYFYVKNYSGKYLNTMLKLEKILFEPDVDIIRIDLFALRKELLLN